MTDLIDLTDENNNIPECVVEIKLCQPNPMCSKGSRLFMNRFDETIIEYEKECGLRIKREVIDTYKIDELELD